MTAVSAMIRRDVSPATVVSHAKALAPAFDELWVVEDLPYAGGISQLTAVLEATTDHGTVVGHGIAPAPFRSPTALAMEWATLESLYPGRLAAGVGHGVQSWMAQLGEAVASPLTLLRETITTIVALLEGQTVKTAGRYVHIDEVALEFPPTNAPRVSAGVTGPKSLHLSGEVAGGTIISEGFTPDQLRAKIALIDEGRAAAGRSDDHRVTVFCGYYCGDMELLGPPPVDSVADWAVAAPTPDEAVAGLREVIAAGVDSLVLVPFGSEPEQQLLFAAEQVVPQLKG